jgi:2-methylcitrate dehydratase PrpD
MPMLPSASADKNTPPAYLVDIARFACNTRFEDLPAAVVDRSKRLVADCLAIVSAGNQSDELKAFARSYLADAQPGRSWVVGTPHRARARDAGFLNGIASTWHDFDEGSTIAYSHPGSQTIPAAFAAAQELGVSGSDLIAGVVMGYEVCARVGRASRMRVSVHPHGVVGTIGSAVAVARMKCFDEARMRQTINIAATMAMAANRQAMLDEATVRNVYSGHSALAGLTAVQLVEAGFTGQRDGIGFTYGTVIADGFDPQKMTERLGDEWLITQGYFKLHPAGRYSHAAIDALEDALARVPGRSIDPARIRRIEVKAFQMAALLSGKDITTSFGTKFSIPFALATILLHGRSSIEAFDIGAVRNPNVQGLVAKVDVTEDPAYTAAYPGRQLCDVTIHLDDGRTIAGHCEVMKGEPSNPHKAEEVERKFFDVTTPIWGRARAEKLYESVLRVERETNMSAFGRGFAL